MANPLSRWDMETKQPVDDQVESVFVGPAFTGVFVGVCRETQFLVSNTPFVAGGFPLVSLE